jgi:molybdopterin/thiamine biosynthesis adenylyltransferase
MGKLQGGESLVKPEMNDGLLQRYSRQILMPEIDIAGQEALRNSRVLIAGMGGLGCPVALYLAAAGVGRLVIADGDTTELSNMQRQIAHTHAGFGVNKAVSVARTLANLNPDCDVDVVDRFLQESDARQLFPQQDLIIDCSDNFRTRDLINAACVKYRLPLISGAAIRGEGQLALFDLRSADSPCYRCLYPSPGDPGPVDQQLGCNSAGVLGPLVGVIGSLQALEAVNLLLGKVKMNRPLLVFDAFDCQFRSYQFRKNLQCPVCSGSF